MDLFDIVKTWVGINYPDLMVESLNKKGNPDSQIRISVAPGIDHSILNSIVAIYEEPYKGRKIYYRNNIDIFWSSVDTNPCHHDYFDKLKMAIDTGLEHYTKWVKNGHRLETVNDGPV